MLSYLLGEHGINQNRELEQWRVGHEANPWVRSSSHASQTAFEQSNEVKKNGSKASAITNRARACKAEQKTKE